MNGVHLIQGQYTFLVQFVAPDMYGYFISGFLHDFGRNADQTSTFGMTCNLIFYLHTSISFGDAIYTK